MTEITVLQEMGDEPDAGRDHDRAGRDEQDPSAAGSEPHAV